MNRVVEKVGRELYKHWLEKKKEPSQGKRSIKNLSVPCWGKESWPRSWEREHCGDKMNRIGGREKRICKQSDEEKRAPSHGWIPRWGQRQKQGRAEEEGG